MSPVFKNQNGGLVMKCQSLACPECGETASIITETGDLVIMNGALKQLQSSYDGRESYVPFKETLLELDDWGECGNCGQSFRLAEFLETQE